MKNKKNNLFSLQGNVTRITNIEIFKTMTNFILKSTLFIICILGLINISSAQSDYMFTQYMWNEIYVNPAYAGSREAMSVTGLYRNQWVGVNGSPVTQTLSVHAPFFDQHLGVGINYMGDQIGVSKKHFFSLSMAYRIHFGKIGKLSFGLSSGMLNQKELLSQVQTATPGDQFFQSTTPRISMPNAGFGMFWYADKYYVGVSIPKMLKNEFTDNGAFKVTNKLDPKTLHFYLTGGYVYTFSNGIKIKPTTIIKSVYGAPFEVDLSLQALFKEMFWIGAAWRSGDAASFIATVYLNPQLRIGYSYDYSFTDIRKYTSGSHEICVGYDFSLNQKKIVSPRLF